MYVIIIEKFMQSYSVAQREEGLRECEFMREAFERFFAHEDPNTGEQRNMKVIICPVLPHRASLHHQTLLSIKNDIYPMLWNITGRSYDYENYVNVLYLNFCLKILGVRFEVHSLSDFVQYHLRSTSNGCAGRSRHVARARI